MQIVATDPDGDTLSYSATGLPDGLTIDSASGLISGTLSFTSAGTHNVTVTVSDGALSDSASFTWTVSDISQTPVITSPGDQTNTEGDVVSLQIVATDPEGDALSYSATGLPDGLAIDPTSGLISGTLAEGTAGSHLVTVTVSDGQFSPTVIFVWTVNPEPDTGGDGGGVSPPALFGCIGSPGKSASARGSAAESRGDLLVAAASLISLCFLNRKKGSR